MTIVSLSGVSAATHAENEKLTHVKAALELAIPSKLHEYDLIKRQADQIQRFGDRGRGHILRVGHDARYKSRV